MKFKFTIKLFPFILAGIVLSLSNCDTRVEVNEQNVANILQTLSSDEMKGRSAFSPEAALAANFISSEFHNIGLEPFADYENYHQSFTIYSITTDNASVRVNNEEIEDQNYFFRVNAEKIDWNKEDADILYISQSDTFRAKIRQYSNDNISSVIFIDEVHKNWFHRYRKYFSRPTRTFHLNNSENDVFVLFSDKVSSFEVTVKNKIENIELFNVIGKIAGKRADEIVIFSAHYDHIGVQSIAEGDSIANGANDNASGVTAVIELARYFKALPKPERTLLFVGFTAEEAGGYGSTYFSEQLDPEEIVAMFNIEMIGKPAVDEANSAWITGFELSTFGKILQKSVEDSSFKFYPDPYPNQNLFYRSDNATLARLGVPAHSISTTPIDVDEDYHRVSDEFNTIDIPHTTNTISAIAKAAEKIVSGKKTPTRIDTEALD